MLKLLLAIDLSKNSRAQTLGSNDTQTTNHAANTDIDKHTLLAISWTSPKSRKNSPNDNQPSISQKPRLYNEMLHTLNIIDRRLLRRIHSNSHGPNNTTET